MSTKPLWSTHKTEDDIIYHAQTDSDTVIYNLLEDIKCLKEDSENVARLEAKNKQLRLALELSKEMFIANGLILDRTFLKIDEALSK